MGVKLTSKIKLCLTIALCAAWLIGCVWLMKVIYFDANAPLTSENTYQVTIPTSEITFKLKTHVYRSRERLLMYVGDDCYRADVYYRWVFSDQSEEKSTTLPQLKAEPEITLTVFEDEFLLGDRLCVVDIRSPTTVYLDIAISNKRYARNRAVFPEVIVVLFFIFMWGLYQICCKFLPNEYRKTFSKIEAVVNKVFKKSQKKKKSNPPVVQATSPPNVKRTPSEGVVFRDEE